METKILTGPPNPNPGLAAVRNLSQEEWIAKYASGTLRHAAALDLRHRDLYIEERTAFEFGWEFQCVTSRVLFNDCKAEGDCSAITELVWHARRAAAMSRYEGDSFAAKYIHHTIDENTVEEGAGIIVSNTSAAWVPKGHLIFAFTSTYTKNGGWAPSVNPL